MIPFQPTLPAPGSFTDQELEFLDDSPPMLFAENQNSNIGLLRKLISDKNSEVVQQIATLYQERFIATASQTLDQWETELGLPITPAGLTDQQRRARLTARRRTGPFTRTRRQQVIETYLLSTFGETMKLTIDGAPLSVDGIPLYSNATSLVGLYTITEDVENFHYTVRIDATAQVDAAGLVRELQSITPAGISFDIVFGNQGPPTTFIPKAGGGNAIGKASGTQLNTQGVKRSAAVTWVEFETP